MTTAAAVRQFYDQVHGQGDGIREDNPRFYPWIVRLLRPTMGAALLDVGCGQGDLLTAAARAGLRTAGIDISSVAIEHVKQLVPQADARLGPAETLPWPDASFEYVVNLGSLEHFLDPGQGIREMTRVLTPSGTACIMLPNVFWLGSVLEVWRTGDYGAVWQIVERSGTVQQWRRLLETHGLQVRRVVRYNRPAKLFDAQRRLRSLRKFVWRGLLNACTPFNLSWHFVYLCSKSDGHA